MGLGNTIGNFLCTGNKPFKVVGTILTIQIVFGLIYGIYLGLGGDDWNAGSDNDNFALSMLNGQYASAIITTSVGFGDFYPLQPIGKILVKIHAALIFLFILFVGFLECS